MAHYSDLRDGCERQKGLGLNQHCHPCATRWQGKAAINWTQSHVMVGRGSCDDNVCLCVPFHHLSILVILILPQTFDGSF